MSFKAGEIEAMLTLNSSQFSSGIASATALVNPLVAAIAVAGAVAIGAATAIGTISVAAVKLAAEAEQASVALTTMLGDAGRAHELLSEINAFAASTPFETPELVGASKKLLAFGTAADQIIPTMRTLGDLSAGLGIPVAELADLYGKARVSGRLMAEDINQLTGRGIPVIGEFAKQFGVAESEVRGLVQSGKIGFPHLQQALVNLTGEGGKFGGMMEAQSQTVSGLWSTLTDTLTMSTTQLGLSIVENLDVRDAIKEITISVQVLGEAVLPIVESLLGKVSDLGDTGRMAGDAVLGAAEIMAMAIGTAGDRIQLMAAGWYVVREAAGNVIAGILGRLETLAIGLDWITEKLTGKASEMAESIGALRNAVLEEVAEDANKAGAAWNIFANSENQTAVGKMFDDIRSRAEELRNEVNDSPIAPLEIIASDTPEKMSKAQEAVKKLREEVEAFGLSDNEKTLNTIISAGADDAQISEAKSLLAQLDEKSKLKGMQDAAKKIAEEMMTPADKWEKEITQLNALLVKGFLDQETFDRALETADEEYKKATAVKGTGSKGSLASLIQGGSAAASKYQAELALMTRGGDDTKAEMKRQTALQERTAKGIEKFNASGGGDVVDISGGYA